MKPSPYSPEDLQIWREDPMTRWVLQALRSRAERCRDQWMLATWGSDLQSPPGSANPLELHELKAWADGFLAAETASYEEICEQNGEIPTAE